VYCPRGLDLDHPSRSNVGPLRTQRERDKERRLGAAFFSFFECQTELNSHLGNERDPLAGTYICCAWSPFAAEAATDRNRAIFSKSMGDNLSLTDQQQRSVAGPCSRGLIVSIDVNVLCTYLMDRAGV